MKDWRITKKSKSLIHKILHQFSLYEYIKPVEFILQTNRGQHITGVTAAYCRSGLRAQSGNIKKGLAGASW